jgi:hypothetical protein
VRRGLNVQFWDFEIGQGVRSFFVEGNFSRARVKRDRSPPRSWRFIWDPALVPLRLGAGREQGSRNVRDGEARASGRRGQSIRVAFTVNKSAREFWDLSLKKHYIENYN